MKDTFGMILKTGRNHPDNFSKIFQFPPTIVLTSNYFQLLRKLKLDPISSIQRYEVPSIFTQAQLSVN